MATRKLVLKNIMRIVDESGVRIVRAAIISHALVKSSKRRMNKMNNVYEVSIMSRVMWDLHSLNNEGSVGNVTEPRTVILANGAKTDGISGEMLKHIHVEKMWELEMINLNSAIHARY